MTEGGEQEEGERLGLNGWYLIAGLAASVATVAAFVLGVFGGDDESSGVAVATSCGTGVSWEQARPSKSVSTVEGPVVSATYSAASDSRPTYLNVGRDYPDEQRFTVVIFGEDRSNFDRPPEDTYDGKVVAASGEVTEFEGVRQMIVNHPNDLAIC